MELSKKLQEEIGKQTRKVFTQMSLDPIVKEVVEIYVQQILVEQILEQFRNEGSDFAWLMKGAIEKSLESLVPRLKIEVGISQCLV